MFKRSIARVLKFFSRYWKSLLQDERLKALNPDVDLSGGHFHNMTTYLLRTPQLFFHPAGYSNTWSKQRGPVQDIELPSLVVLCQSRSEIEDMLRLASWRKILAEIIVAVERMNYDEKGLKNTTVSIRLIRRQRFAKCALERRCSCRVQCCCYCSPPGEDFYTCV